MLSCTIDKGVQWSDIEHLTLYGFATHDFTIDEFQEYSGLPRPIISECITRLMYAGWVEVVETEGRIAFKASPRGLAVVESDSLPFISKEIKKNLYYIIDKLSGSVFPIGNITLVSELKVIKLLKSKIIENSQIIPATFSPVDLPGIYEITNTILTNPSEKFIGYDSVKSWRNSNNYLKLTVTGDEIEGLPNTSGPLFKGLIDNHMRSFAIMPRSKDKFKLTNPLAKKEWSKQNIKINNDDLFIGGASNKSLLESVFSGARSRIIIHSTFICIDKFEEKIPLFKGAVKRGVDVSLLWDMGEDDSGAGRTLRKCRELLEKNHLTRGVSLHSAPTKSHAKLIVADDRGKGYFAVVGSCNWLCSGFRRLEVSVRLRHPCLVADCVSMMEQLIRRPKARRRLLREQLEQLECKLRAMPEIEKGNCSAYMISSASHEFQICEARDNAQNYIFVASDRLGGAAETQILVATDSAARSRKVDVTVCYRAQSGPAKGDKILNALTEKYGGTVQIEQKSGSHAKFLCWDSDNIVITSLNWLSKDADDGNRLGEIGVVLNAPGLADYLIEQYLAIS